MVTLGPGWFLLHGLNIYSSSVLKGTVSRDFKRINLVLWRPRENPRGWGEKIRERMWFISQCNSCLSQVNILLFNPQKYQLKSLSKLQSAEILNTRRFMCAKESMLSPTGAVGESKFSPPAPTVGRKRRTLGQPARFFVHTNLLTFKLFSTGTVITSQDLSFDRNR